MLNRINEFPSEVLEEKNQPYYIFLMPLATRIKACILF